MTRNVADAATSVPLLPAFVVATIPNPHQGTVLEKTADQLRAALP